MFGWKNEMLNQTCGVQKSGFTVTESHLAPEKVIDYTTLKCYRLHLEKSFHFPLFNQMLLCLSMTDRGTSSVNHHRAMSSHCFKPLLQA